MKKLVTTIFAAALVASSAAWGKGDHDGDGRHGKHGNKHAEKQWKKEHKQWAKHRGRGHDEVVVQHYYAPPPPVIERHYHYAPPRVYSPPPGVHVVLPSIYMPF